MAIQLSVAARNARLNAIETVLGTAPLLRIYTGTQPADCATAASGTLLAEATLPSDWLAAAANGSIAMSGSWSDSAANGTGTAGYYRFYDSAGTNCHLQGTVTLTGGGGDMTVNNTSFATNQVFTVTSYSLTDANA
jgi:sulfur carrier protein ThiS